MRQKKKGGNKQQQTPGFMATAPPLAHKLTAYKEYILFVRLLNKGTLYVYRRQRTPPCQIQAGSYFQ